MDRFKPPNSVSLEVNLLQNWKIWKQSFTLFMTATEHNGKSDEVKTSLLLHCIGEKTREVYNTFAFSSIEDSMKYNKVLEHFEAYFGPRKNITYSRLKFFTYRQEPGQTFDDYLTEIRKLSSNCNLFELRESLLRDMLIIGLNDTSLQERLLREPNLDLTKTIGTCRTLEMTRSHAHAIQNGNALAEFDLHEIRKRSLQHKAQPRTQSSEIISKCKFCTYSHKRGSCPAYGKSFNNCEKKGHFSKSCPNFDSKVDLFNKIWIIVTQTQNFSTVENHFL